MSSSQEVVVIPSYWYLSLNADMPQHTDLQQAGLLMYRCGARCYIHTTLVSIHTTHLAAGRAGRPALTGEEPKGCSPSPTALQATVLCQPEQRPLLTPQQTGCVLPCRRLLAAVVVRGVGPTAAALQTPGLLS